MKNGKVAQAQHLLQGHNRWEKHFYKGPLDGVYGEDTAGAVRECKYYLGYPRKRQTSTFGHTLYGYLVGPSDPQHLNLPRMYKFRHGRRVARANDWHNNVIAYAKQDLGYHESPAGSNMNKFGAWYGMNGVPWCAIFVSYGLNHVRRGPKWFRYAYVPYIVRDARAGLHGMSVTHDPTEACLACYDWDDDGIADHVEFFEGWIDKGRTFWAVGGNTGPTNLSNGGEVMRSRRNETDVQAYVYVP